MKINQSSKEKNKTHLLFAFVIGVSILVYVGYIKSAVERKLSDSYSENIQEIKKSEPAPAVRSGQARAEVQFNFGNGVKRRFEGNIYRGVSIAEAINAAAKAGNIRVVWHEQRVLVSDSKTAPEQKLVAVYKNNQPIVGDLEAMLIADNDEIELHAE